MIRFLKYIVQKHNQMNIPNLLNGWQATAGFIGKWFKKAFFVNKNVHFYFRNRYIYTHYFFFIQHIVKWLSNIYIYIYICMYVCMYVYIDTYTYIHCHTQTYFPIISILSVWAAKYWEQIFTEYGCQKTLDQTGKCIFLSPSRSTIL